jgi:hypothetical protein
MLPDPLDPHATHPQSPDADPTFQPGLEPGPGREAATESDSRPPASGPAPTPSGRRTPWVQLKTYTNHPTVYPAMVRGASPGAKGGDLVTVYDKEGREFAAGLWNPKARVPLRVVHHGPEGFTEADFLRLLDHAVDLRLNTLGFGSSNDTDAYPRHPLRQRRPQRPDRRPLRRRAQRLGPQPGRLPATAGLDPPPPLPPRHQARRGRGRREPSPASRAFPSANSPATPCVR